jgi:phage terminase large subunit-like protein
MSDLLLYAAEAEECRRSLKAFVKKAWEILEPGTTLKWNWHLDAICEHLQAIYEGQIHRLVISIAPGHTKSTVISQAFPMWTWTQDPTLRWLCASTDLGLALRDNRNSRYLVESEWYRACYGREFHINQTSFDLSPDLNMKSFYENDHKGYRLGTSVTSKNIGRRASHLLIDDPHDPMEGDTRRLDVLEWFGQTWISRLNDQENGTMIIVGQRIHDQDLSGHVLKLGGWEHLNLPEEYKPKRRCVTKIGWSDPRTTEGELLWPEKFPRHVLDTLKKGLGSLGYSAQYQQAPTPEGGAVFKESWFRYFSIQGDYYALETPEGLRHIPIRDCWRFTVVDLAISTKQSADYTVIQTYDVSPANDLLLIDQVRGHFDNPEQQRRIRLTYLRFRPQFVQIESVAYQLSIIQQLRDDPIEPVKLTPNPIEVGDFLVRTASPEALDSTLRQLPGMRAWVVKDSNGEYAHYQSYSVVRVQGDIYFFRYAVEQQGYCEIVSDVLQEDLRAIEQQARQKFSIPIKEYRPVRDKVSRASVGAIILEQGKMYWGKHLPELEELKTEHLRFPKYSHDDMVDLTSQSCEIITVPAGPNVYNLNELTPEEKHQQEEQAKKPIDPFEYADRVFGGAAW